MSVIEIKPKGETTVWSNASTRPENAVNKTYTYKIFLAGTIDMGNSEDWQKAFIKYFTDIYNEHPDHFDYVFYNPRRVNGFGDDLKELEYQFNWEQDHLHECDRIIMNILGTSKSPITLLEMGEFLGTSKLCVICEKNFYRYNVVRLACERYGTKLYESMEEFLKNEITI